MKPIVNKYSQDCQNSISDLVLHIELLEKRLLFCRENFSQKSDFEKNEIQILELETKSQLTHKRKDLTHRTVYFESYMQTFTKDVEELEEKYEETLAKVTANKDKIKGARDFLHAVRWDVINTNMDSKISFYKELKKFLQK
jgi:hypothetical protein